MRSLIVTNSRSPKSIISRFRIHHAIDTPIIVQYGIQAQSCYWRRSCGIELGDCSRVWNEWVHDQSLAQRSGQTFQRRTEDVGETYNNGSLYPEVSWARPADIGVVYRKKWSRWANVLSFYESRCKIWMRRRCARAFINAFTGVQRQSNGSSQNLRSRKAKLYCYTCRRCRWD